MDSIHINVSSSNQVALRLEEFPDELYEALRVEIDSLTHELFGLVEAATPSRTGKLRSQERVRIFADKDHIKGYIDVAGESGSQDFAKAGALEYGSHKPAHVSAYTRPHDVLVAAYDRTPNIAEYAFERGPLAAMQPEINSRLNAVVEQVIAKVNE